MAFSSKNSRHYALIIHPLTNAVISKIHNVNEKFRFKLKYEVSDLASQRVLKVYFTIINSCQIKQKIMFSHEGNFDDKI